MVKLRFVLIFSITLLSVGVRGERRIDFKNCNHTFNQDYFKSFVVTIENNTISLDMVMLKPVLRGFKVHIDYMLRMPNAKTYQSIFSRHVDVCAVVTAVKDNLLKSWFRSIASHSNFKVNCPVEVGHYYMRNWKMGSSMMHKFLYPGQYRSNLNFFYGKYHTKTENRVLSITAELVTSD